MFLLCTNEPRQANLVLIAYSISEGSGEPAHPRWACAVKICHDGMLEDTNSLDGAQIIVGSDFALNICTHNCSAYTAAVGRNQCINTETINQLSPVKRICVFEHSVITNFNCACPVIQRGQGSGSLSEGSS